MRIKMKLHKIKAEDLIFSGNIEDDRTNTFLKLDDYDWMHYSLSTIFHTNDLGIINVEFEYLGLGLCRMTVTDMRTEEKAIYQYPRIIFQTHIIEFMQNHIKSWDSKYAFNGEDEVISFFNDVIENGEITEINGKSKKKDATTTA